MWPSQQEESAECQNNHVRKIFHRHHINDLISSPVTWKGSNLAVPRLKLFQLVLETSSSSFVRARLLQNKAEKLAAKVLLPSAGCVLYV